MNRRVEENGLSEASSPAQNDEYNVLAGGPRDGVPRHAIAAIRVQRTRRRHAHGQVRFRRPATASLPRPSTTATEDGRRNTPRLLEVGWTRGAGA